MRATEIFVEQIPIVGKVPMCFFLPKSAEQSDLKKLIENHGGRYTEIHESFTF